MVRGFADGVILRRRKLFSSQGAAELPRLLPVEREGTRPHIAEITTFWEFVVQRSAIDHKGSLRYIMISWNDVLDHTPVVSWPMVDMVKGASAHPFHGAFVTELSLREGCTNKNSATKLLHQRTIMLY